MSSQGALQEPEGGDYSLSHATHIHAYGGATQLEASIPHGECFLALGFELQPVELCSSHRVRMLQRLCPVNPTRACLTSALLTAVTSPTPSPKPRPYMYTLPQIPEPSPTCIHPHVITLYCRALYMALMSHQMSRGPHHTQLCWARPSDPPGSLPKRCGQRCTAGAPSPFAPGSGSDLPTTFIPSTKS